MAVYIVSESPMPLGTLGFENLNCMQWNLCGHNTWWLIWTHFWVPYNLTLTGCNYSGLEKIFMVPSEALRFDWYYSAGFDSLKTYEEGRSRSLEDKIDDGVGKHSEFNYFLSGLFPWMIRGTISMKNKRIFPWNISVNNIRE